MSKRNNFKDNPLGAPMNDPQDFAPADSADNLPSVQPTEANVGKPTFFMNYLNFIQNLKALLEAGYDPEDVEKRWQAYYATLSEHEQRSAWRYKEEMITPLLRDLAARSPAEPQPEPQPAPEPLPPEAAVVAEEVAPEEEPANFSEPLTAVENNTVSEIESNPPTPEPVVADPNLAVPAEPLQRPEPPAEESITSQLNIDVGAALKASRPAPKAQLPPPLPLPSPVTAEEQPAKKAWKLPFGALQKGEKGRFPFRKSGQAAEVAAEGVAPAQTSAGEPTAENQSIETLLPDQNIKHKARNIFNWNSPTALFDKKEKKEIKRQNLKSLLFGLSFASFFSLLLFFAFFNERFIQPFVKPASYSNEVQAIIPPGGRNISDPSWKVIIPKLGIAPPVVGGVEAYRSKNRSESAAVFEQRMQKALESGVVHYPSTPLPGQNVKNGKSNVVIVGHSSSNLFTPGDYKSVFSSLRNLEKGDLILLNYEKVQYVYKIYERKIINPNQVEVLGPAARNHSLTLITCHPPGSNGKRLVVVAEQISPNPSGNTYVDAEINNTDNIVVPGPGKGFRDAFFD